MEAQEERLAPDRAQRGETGGLRRGREDKGGIS
jgi:hypothetical protein